MNNGRVSSQDTQSILLAAQPQAAQSGGRRALAIIWDFWKAYAERIAFYQTTVLLTLIYLLIAGPTWLIARIGGHNFLPLAPRSAATFWREVNMGHASSAEELTKQG